MSYHYPRQHTRVGIRSVNAALTGILGRSVVNFVRQNYLDSLSTRIHHVICQHVYNFRVTSTSRHASLSHAQTPINAALITLSAKNISPDNQFMIFSSHCARIQPVVDQVE